MNKKRNAELTKWNSCILTGILIFVVCCAEGNSGNTDADTADTATDSDTDSDTDTDSCEIRLTDTPVGFAAMDNGTVGGGDASPIEVTTPEQLISYLKDDEPRVLHVMNDLDFRTEDRGGVPVCLENTLCDNGAGEMVDEPRVSDNCDPHEHAGTSYRNETRVDVASNKTIIGIGPNRSGATLYGASFRIGSSNQIIVRNLVIRDINPHLVEAGDGLTMQGASYIWVDHVRFEAISDGVIDIGSSGHTEQDRNITLSWNHINGRMSSRCGGKHNYVNFVDNGHVTYHHNFYDNCGGRNPKISGETANVHLYNNYWLNVSYFCITAQYDGEARVESNYFENASRPHWLQTDDGNGTAGIATDSGNVYTGASSSSNRDSGGNVFSVPYAYEKEDAETARERILNCVGPQQIR